MRIPLLNNERTAEKAHSGVKEGLAKSEVRGVDERKEKRTKAPRRGALVCDKPGGVPERRICDAWVVE